MKNYFKKSRVCPFFPGWTGPLHTPWGLPSSVYGNKTSAGIAPFGLEGEREEQIAALHAIKDIVDRERGEYQQQIQRNSRRTYCVVCEKTAVTASALRCASCCRRSPRCTPSSLLPSAFNPNRTETPEDEAAGGSTSPLAEHLASYPPRQGIATEEYLIQTYGAGLETDRDEETDQRPAVWCHQKSCKNDLDAKGLLICSKCRRSFHAGCCDPPLNFEMVTRFPWQCADCKICEICYSNRNEETMLICDACDRAFHMECLDPPVDEVPDGDWFCKGCGYCSCCGRQLTEEEALDTSCFYSNRNRICPECKEKYLKAKRGRVIRQGDLSFDAVYAACSNKHAIARLCEVCVAPLESDGKGPLKRVWCTDCKISVHLGCAEPGASPNEHVCHICNGFREDFLVESKLETFRA